MANTILVPKGKKILLNQGNHSLLSNDIEMVLEEDITFTLSSTFAPLVTPPNTNFINMIGSAIRDVTKGAINFSGQWKQLGFQTWQGTDPIQFTCNVGFYMGSSGYDDGQIEVYDPIIELCNVALPSEGTGGNLQAPGPSVLDALNLKNSYTLGRTVSMELGNVLRLPNIIIVKAEPTLSLETDSNNFPIWGKVSLDIRSIFSATIELLAFNKPKVPVVPPPGNNSPVLTPVSITNQAIQNQFNAERAIVGGGPITAAGG